MNWVLERVSFVRDLDQCFNRNLGVGPRGVISEVPLRFQAGVHIELESKSDHLQCLLD